MCVCVKKERERSLYTKQLTILYIEFAHVHARSPICVSFACDLEAVEFPVLLFAQA